MTRAQATLDNIVAHPYYFTKFIPFICWSTATAVILVLVGIYLHRVLRRNLRGKFWTSRVAAVAVPVCTIVVASRFAAELFIILPAVAGLFAGWALRHRLTGSTRPLALAVFVGAGSAATIAVGGVLRLARIGLWDALAMVLAASLGYVAGCWRERAGFPWGRVTLAGGALCASLLAAEFLVHALLPPLPKYYAEHPTQIRFPPFDLVHIETVAQTPFDIPVDFTLCAELFEDTNRSYPAAFPQFLGVQQPVPKRAVLHLGDSVTQGLIDDEGEAFPERLQHATPDVRQINLGQGGTGPDFYYLIAHEWVPRLPIELVVVHIFLGNDIWDIGRPYRCCADGPLLKRAGERVESRCPTPRWADGFGESFAWFAANSPPPSIVRQLTPDSQFARHLVAAIMSIQRRRSEDPRLWGREVQESQWLTFEAILRTLRDEMAERQVPLVVSLLPVNGELQNGAWNAPGSFRVRALDILNRLGIETLDPWYAFASVVKRDGPDAVFLPKGDVHFNANGHKFYAEWLLQRLGPRLGVAEDSSARTR